MRNPLSWFACFMISGIAAIVGCSGASNSVPTGTPLDPRSPQRGHVIADSIPTMPPGALVEYPIPSGGNPYFIAPAGDGNLWFTEAFANRIGRITTAGVITEFSAGAISGLNDMRTGPDGHPWFGAYGPDAIGRVAFNGNVQLYPIPSPTGHPEQLVGDAARNVIWITELRAHKIGEFSLATHTFTEYTIPPPNNSFRFPVGPMAVALDKSGNVWFSDSHNNQVDEMSGGGTILQRITLPTVALDEELLTLWRMTLGSDGNLWLVEEGSSSVGFHGSVVKIDPLTGSYAIYVAPSSKSFYDNPFDVVAVSDGVWIAEGTIGVAHISNVGVFKEYLIPGSGPAGITVGSDNNLWFADYNQVAIGKVLVNKLH